MRNQMPLFALVALLGCGNQKANDKTVPPTPDVKPVVSALAKTEPKLVASAPSSMPVTSEPAALASNKQLLYDPREKLPTQNIPKEEQEKLLTKLFPKHLKAMKDCKNPEPGTKSSEEDLAAGQFAPSVISSATGAFTVSGTTQTAYVIDVGECNADMTRDTPETSGMLVITNGEEITIKQKDFGHWKYVKAIDLDQDGRAELMCVDEYDGMETSGYLSVFKFDDKEFKAIEGIPDTIISDTCALVEATKDQDVGPYPGDIKVSLISYAPAEAKKMPSFSEEKLVSSCDKGATFKPAPKEEK
jgi:hypothetical protein